MSELNSALGIFFTVLLLTSFVKMATSLTIFRVGLGLNQSGFGLVVIALSLALSLLVMSPQLSAVGGINGFFSGKLVRPDADYERNFMPFLQKNSDPQIVQRLGKFTRKEAQPEKPAKNDNAKTEAPVKADSPSPAQFEVTIAAFMLTELKEAFQIGLVILIPFLVVDLLVANCLVLLGTNQLNPELVSLPVKLALFFAVDGWTLMAEKLLRTYL